MTTTPRALALLALALAGCDEPSGTALLRFEATCADSGGVIVRRSVGFGNRWACMRYVRVDTTATPTPERVP